MPSQPQLSPSASSSDTSRPPSSPCSGTTTMACISSPPPPPPPQPPGDRTAANITSRPKLTLQTSSLPRTSGTSSTGLSFSFASGPGASPTVRNTFRNAYDVTSPSSETSSPSRASSSRLSESKPSSPYAPHTTHHHNPFSYRSPYQLPLGVRSILRNSPLEASTRRRSGSISATSANASARRVFFPAKKHVTYRHPLEEEIRTERYTAQHIDLYRAEAEEQVDTEHNHRKEREQSNDTASDEEDDSDDSSLSLSETSNSGDETSDTSLSKAERKKRRSMGVERQVRAVALLDGLEADPYAPSTPQTPRQGRVKRRRDWKWTLEPITPALPPDNSC